MVFQEMIWSIFLDTVTPHGLRNATCDEVTQRMGHIDTQVILCGHTHLPKMFRLKNGQLIINAGSVGLQAYEDEHPFPHKVENGTPHARYVVLEKRNLQWIMEIVAVSYDWEKAASHAASIGRKDHALALKYGYMA